MNSGFIQRLYALLEAFYSAAFAVPLYSSIAALTNMTKTTIFATILVIVNLSAKLWAHPPDMVAREPLAWCNALNLIEGGSTNLTKVSPDGQYAACAKEDKEDVQHTYTSVYLASRGMRRLLHRYRDIGPSRTLEWSPESKYFAFNWTDGGTTGVFYVDVFDKNRRYRISKRIERDYRRTHSCQADTAVNVMFIRWDSDSRVAVSARVYGRERRLCRHPSTKTYLVSVPSGSIEGKFH